MMAQVFTDAKGHEVFVTWVYERRGNRPAQVEGWCERCRCRVSAIADARQSDLFEVKEGQC